MVMSGVALWLPARLDADRPDGARNANAEANKVVPEEIADLLVWLI